MTSRHSAPSQRRGRRAVRWWIVEIVVAFSLIAGSAVGLGACSADIDTGTTSPAAPLTTTAPSQTTDQSTATTPTDSGSATTGVSETTGSVLDGLASPAEAVANKLSPSVVNIAISGTVQTFFGEQAYSGEGSGVIYTSDGMIVTNNHVVSDDSGNPVSKLEVTLATGEQLPATIVGRDPLTDLAVIKIDPSHSLPAATFIQDQPSVGEYAIAIGSPLGFENSVTLGIVSGLNRSIEGVGGAEGVALNNLIQTDAPISPGNSGGALANSSGAVIGINVAYLPPQSTGASNIGFAIPSVVATQVADEIIQTGKATHAYIGIGTQTVTSDLQQQFGLSRSSGVLVAQVTANGPAQKAGIEQGDIIIKVDGEDMIDSSDLLVAIRDMKPGDVVQVTFVRDGNEQTVSVTLEERPADLLQ